MGHDVFISHSSLDKLAADAVCHGLEAKGIRCWIAPRDQIAGRAYGEQITSAIESAQVVVLVFSDNVNKSQAVLNEINIAAGANVTIVPFRLAAVEFNSELHFYLGRMHWLDAFPQPIDSYIDTLVSTIRRNLKHETVAETPDPPVPPVEAVAPAVAPEPVVAAPPPPAAAPPYVPPPPAPHPKTDLRPLAFVGVGVGVLLLIALVVGLSPHPAPIPNTVGGNAIQAAITNRVVSAIDSDNEADDKDDDDAKPAAAGGPPRGDGSETTPVRASNDQAMTYYETELAPNGPPATLDGATVISTSQLLASLKDRDAGRAPFWLIDARGCTNEPTIPTATCVSSIDELEQKSPDKATQIVVFCHDGSCPMSYVLASAAVAAGYDNVFWYRGGINAWMAAGLPPVTHIGIWP